MSEEQPDVIAVKWSTSRSGCIGALCFLLAIFLIIHGIVDPVMDEDGSRRSRGVASILNSMVYANIGIGQLIIGGLLAFEATRQFIRASDRYAFRSTKVGIAIAGQFVSWDNVREVERQVTSNGSPDRIAIRYRLNPQSRLRSKLYRTLDFDDGATISFLELADAKGKLMKVSR